MIKLKNIFLVFFFFSSLSISSHAYVAFTSVDVKAKSNPEDSFVKNYVIKQFKNSSFSREYVNLFNQNIYSRCSFVASVIYTDLNRIKNEDSRANSKFIWAMFLKGMDIYEDKLMSTGYSVKDLDKLGGGIFMEKFVSYKQSGNQKEFNKMIEFCKNVAEQGMDISDKYQK